MLGTAKSETHYVDTTRKNPTSLLDTSIHDTVICEDAYMSPVVIANNFLFGHYFSWHTLHNRVLNTFVNISVFYFLYHFTTDLSTAKCMLVTFVFASGNLQDHLTIIQNWLKQWKIRANKIVVLTYYFHDEKNTSPLVTPNL